jgi:hypothetical protein
MSSGGNGGHERHSFPLSFLRGGEIVRKAREKLAPDLIRGGGCVALKRGVFRTYNELLENDSLRSLKAAATQTGFH